jgi:hypothetical protein
MSKQIRENFLKEILTTSGLEVDRRWRKWARWIDQIDQSKSDGYAFVGDFISEGTVEVEVGQPRLILAMAEIGSARYHTACYRVVRLDLDGSLEATDIKTDAGNRGWALRIRDQVAEMLNELAGVGVNPLEVYSDDELIDELTRRGHKIDG